MQEQLLTRKFFYTSNVKTKSEGKYVMTMAAGSSMASIFFLDLLSFFAVVSLRHKAITSKNFSIREATVSWKSFLTSCL